MLEKTNFDEDEILAKVSIEECIRKFEPEVQAIFYDAYGKNLEAFPKELLHLDSRVDNVLEKLLGLRTVRAQKIILMRLGIATGTPMTLDEVANEFGITRERVRQIESVFFSICRPRIRRKKSINY